MQGIEEMGLSLKDLLVIHGSTVATNAVLEGNGVRTVFITNHGFRDMLLIGRQARQELYNLTPANASPMILEELCLETGGRLDAEGRLIEPLGDDTSAPGVVLTHLFDFLAAMLKRLDTRGLSHDGGAHDLVLVDLGHRGADNRGATGIPDSPSGHGPALGEPMEENGAVFHSLQ